MGVCAIVSAEFNEFQDRSALRVYMLGTLPYELFQTLQRRLVYEISGDPELASLVICEHPPVITIGRSGTRQHVRYSTEELIAREWRIRYVARGGGVMLHGPGQIGLYPILPITHLGRTPGQYLAELMQVVVDVIRSLGLNATIDRENPGLKIGDRRVAHAGIAIRSGVSSYGMILNAGPDLELYDRIDCDGDRQPMTSLERELPHRVRIASLRIALANAVAERFGYSRQSVFHSHNILHANTHHR